MKLVLVVTRMRTKIQKNCARDSLCRSKSKVDGEQTLALTSLYCCGQRKSWPTPALLRMPSWRAHGDFILIFTNRSYILVQMNKLTSNSFQIQIRGYSIFFNFTTFVQRKYKPRPVDERVQYTCNNFLAVIYGHQQRVVLHSRSKFGINTDWTRVGQ